MKTWVKCVIAINAIGANLAYGWAASNPCPFVVGYESPGHEKACGSAGDGYFAGIVAAITWPSYMTTQAFKHFRKATGS